MLLPIQGLFSLALNSLHRILRCAIILLTSYTTLVISRLVSHLRPMSLSGQHSELSPVVSE